MFGDLGGDFCKATYEPKMFGMHIRSVLIGLRAENVDLTYVWGWESDVFSKFGDLGGDFHKDTCEPKLFGMHIGTALSGLDAGNVNTDAKMSIVGVENVCE